MVLPVGYLGRLPKPRQKGLTCVIDPGLGHAAFADVIESHSEHIDFVKFGWGTAVVTKRLQDKLAVLSAHGIGFWFGGTLFEIAYAQGQFSRYLAWALRLGARHIEISDGTIDLPHRDKTRIIRELSGEFCVVSEVGKKSPAIQPDASEWADMIAGELAAGARWVILEGREAGTAGMFSEAGAVRDHLIDDILAMGVPPDRLFFEAPRQSQQAWFISRLGADANFANIAAGDVIGLETLRRGLRGDTAQLAIGQIQRQGRAG
jgi:phosphosulfolactate synthase